MPTEVPAGGYDADIIILSRDRIAHTLTAIVSALAQTGLSRRVIVLDQGSRPENTRRLREFCAGYAEIQLVCRTDNLGVAGGRNLASGLGRGRHIIGLDNDALFATPQTAAAAVAALDADVGLAAIGLRILRHADGLDDLSSWGYPPALLPRAGGCFDAMTFVGAGHAIRRTAWEQAGGYDDRLFFCWEEYDFCLRAIVLGWRVRYRGDIVIRHNIAAEARQSWSGTRWFYFVRNRIYIARKTGAPWLFLLPRILGYALRGLRNGLGIAVTANAICAAIRMQAGITPIRLPAAARAYLRRNDTAHRGGLIYRLAREVMAALPLHGPARSPKQPEHQRVFQQVAPP